MAVNATGAQQAGRSGAGAAAPGVSQGGLPASFWRYRLWRQVVRRAPEKLGAGIARVGDDTALGYLRGVAGRVAGPELWRVANGFAQELARTAPARLRRIAERCRQDPAAAAAAVSAALTYEELKLLSAARARRSALRLVKALRNPPLSDATPGDVADKIVEMRIRLLQRTGAVDEALERARTLVRRRPTAAVGYDLLAQIIHPNDPQQAIEVLETRFAACGHDARRSNLLFAELLAATGRRTEGRRFLLTRLARSVHKAEYYVGMANIDLTEDPVQAGEWLQRYWNARGLDIQFPGGRPDIDAVEAKGARPVSGETPLVSIVMTAFNAKTFIGVAIRSLLAQTWRNLEIIVMDDLSEDDTADAVLAIAATDARVRLVKRETNGGTYAAKNGGIAIARGAFIGLMDSDDWWHPLHVERHMKAMLETPRLMVTTSDWVRMEANGRITPTHEGGYQYLNPASTLFRAEVFQEIGFFDCVRIGADTEFLWRLRHRYGRSAERHMPHPLAIGRLHANSLTQSGVGSFDGHMYSPPRLDYWEAWTAWHKAMGDDDAAMRLPAEPVEPARRPFPVPEEILP